MPAKRSRPLEEYGRKRDFQRTPEPKPKTKKSETGSLFVVQKHRASQLHYDFRLELDGVLLSWAIPKGPSLDPSEKRLAVQTEDHPIEYGSFEGIIPEDEYGGGTVMLWDRGQWSPLADARSDIQKGTLKFKLEGHKLRGDWTLVRIKEKGVPTKNWLLIKERDGEARPEDSFSVIDEEPFSAVSARSIGEIAAAKDRVWTGGGAQGAMQEAAVWWRRGLYRRIELSAAELAGAKKAMMRRKFAPFRPRPVAAVPDGDGWIHEILQVGKRVLCFLDERTVALHSVAGDDWTGRLPEIARAAGRLPAVGAVLDGVVSDGIGENWEAPAGDTSSWAYHVFDLLYCDGHDLRAAPLLGRKQVLGRLLENAGAQLLYCDHVEGRGDIVLAEAQRLNAPGIVSKRAASKYSARDAKAWTVVHIRAATVRDGSAVAPGHVKRRQPVRTTTIRERPDLPPHQGGTKGGSAPRRKRAVAADPDASVAGIKLTHPHRILYPEERVSKRMVAEYLEAVASHILPHVAGRPLSLYRCPGGIEKESFFQKQLGEVSSEHVRGTKTGDEPYVVLDDVRGLITLAQWNVLEIHGWGCREGDLDHPDLMIFDLDPGPGVPWEQIVDGAKGVRLLLEELGLASFVKTSGGKGLHVVAPLAPPALPRGDKGESAFPSRDRKGAVASSDEATKPRSHDGWDDVKDFAARVARKIVEVAPKHFTVFMSKPERRGKVFIDYLRNHRGSTCVAPYSTRARPGAFVSTPIDWSDLSGPQPRFHIFQVLERLEAGVDPWRDFFEVKQTISAEAINWLRG